MTPKPLPEASVLSPRDPSLGSSDEWPEYRLNDVTVTLPGRSFEEPVSLLIASEHYPVCVVGRLDSVPDELAHTYILSGKNKRLYIELSDVKSYAYGDLDGSIEVWAAGGAGWFALNPSKAYLSTFNDMSEAVGLLFYLVDAYQTPRKTGKGRNAVVLPDYTARELFEKYASEVLDDESSLKEATEIFHKHREFLISSMLTGTEGMAWSSNPLYKHLYKKFPGDFSRIRQRLAGPDKTIKKAPRPLAHARQPSLESESTTSSTKRKRGRPPKNAPSDITSLDSASVASSTLTETQSRATKSKPTKARSTATTRSTRHKGGSVESSAPISGTETPEIEESQQEAQSQDSDSDTLPNKHKRKSALRLKPIKASKGPPRSSNVPEDDEDDAALPSSPAPNGKRKRNEPNGAKSQPKRRSSKYDVDEGIDIPASPSSEEVADSPDAELGAIDTSLPVRLNHQYDSVQEDTWICALDGCMHKVYAASLPESQKLIREHYALHAYDDDDRVQLVKRLEAPSMPVSHLMDKVRSQARLEGFPGSRVAGSRFPEPLKTKY